MAKDVIARLKLENSQYNNGIRQSMQMNRNLQGQMSNLNNVVGQFGATLGGLPGKLTGCTNSLLSLGSSIGSVGSLSTTATLGIAGLSAAVVAGTAEFIKYNVELEKVDQMTSVICGTSGEATQEISNAARSLSSVYKTDVRQTIGGINTLMQQFGITGKEATDIVRMGFQGMLEGDQGNMLQMIQQFAPAFRDMGISASELVAIINNTEGGIFGPEGLSAIQMAGKKIREMSNTTHDSLTAIGVDADSMTAKMNDGSLKTIDALREIARKLGQLDPQSQQVGNVLKDVFGRQGANAGQKMIESIATLNTNLEETCTQTGAVGESLAKLEQAENDLSAASRELFGIQDRGWAEWGNNMKSHVLERMTDLTNDVNSLKDSCVGLWEGFSDACDNIDLALRNLVNSGGFDKFMELLTGVSTFDLNNRVNRHAGDNVKTPSSSPEAWANMTKNSPLHKAVQNQIANTPTQYKAKDGTLWPSKKECEQHNFELNQKNKPTKKTGTTGGHTGGKGGGSNKTVTLVLDLSDATTPSAIGIDMAEFGKVQSINQLNNQASIISRLQGDETDPTKLKGYSDALSRISTSTENMQNGNPFGLLSVTDAMRQQMASDVNSGLWSGTGQEKNKFDFKGLEEKTNQLIGGLSSINSGMKNLGLDLGEGFDNFLNGVEGVMQIIQGIQAIISIFQVPAQTANTAALVANTAALTANSVSNFIPFSTGGVVHAANGIVTGSTYVGDAIPAMLNAGETVLTAGQTANLADALTAGGGGGVYELHQRGDEMITTINAAAMRMGYGKLQFA